jgi:glycosyltransferase involved in cell wall biosynthesis
MITIVTSNLNNTDFLYRTARSIRNQTIRCDWIIVDGKSNDEIEKFQIANDDIISHCISEIDTGVYCAWNKALPLIKTEWVLFLGSGDVLFNDNAIEMALKLLNAEYKICYAKVMVVNDNDTHNEVFGTIDVASWQQCRPQTPHHQGVFHHSSIFISKRFDESYRIGGDAKLVLEVMQDSKALFIDTFITKMISGGLSYRLSSIPICFDENRRMVKELSIKKELYNRSLFSDLKLYFKAYGFKIIGSKIIYLIDFYRMLSGRSKSFYD